MVGFSWDTNEEHKMEHTYGFGRSIFGGFTDVAKIAAHLGYQKRGLAALAGEVLGVKLHKARSVSPHVAASCFA